jgi:hypothetical protein
MHEQNLEVIAATTMEHDPGAAGAPGAQFRHRGRSVNQTSAIICSIARVRTVLRMTIVMSDFGLAALLREPTRA